MLTCSIDRETLHPCATKAVNAREPNETYFPVPGIHSTAYTGCTTCQNVEKPQVNATPDIRPLSPRAVLTKRLCMHSTFTLPIVRSLGGTKISLPAYRPLRGRLSKNGACERMSLGSGRFGVLAIVLPADRLLWLGIR